MTIPLPLQVVIQPIGGGTHLDITASVANLRWSSTSPGGYADCSFDFNQQLTFLDLDVHGQFSPVTIYDTRDAEVIWDGLLADPGVYAGQDGEAMRMVAYGAMSTTKHINRPYIIIDRSLDSWGRGVSDFMREEIQVTSDYNASVGGPGILLSAPPGTTFQPLSGIGYVHYLPFIETQQRLGSLFVSDIESGQNSTFRVSYTFGLNTLGTWSYFHNSAPSVTDSEFKAGSQFDAANTCSMAWRHDGTPNPVTVGNGCWTRYGNVAVRPTLVDRHGHGAAIDNTSQTNWREQLEHLVGTGDRLRFAVGDHCDIDDDEAMEDLAPITHQSYPDGVTDDQVLSDFLLLEHRATWHFWERVGDNLYFFEWVAKADAVNFDLDVTYEGLDCPGSTVELFKSVTVRVRDQSGNIRGSYSTHSDVPVLDSAGVHTEDVLDLGDNVGSSNQEIGAAAESFLNAHRLPTRAGTGTVMRPILSHFTEELVDPWRLRAPFRVRYSGAAAGTPGDAPDGKSVFEVVRVSFEANTCAATIELTEPDFSRWDPQSLDKGRRR